MLKLSGQMRRYLSVGIMAMTLTGTCLVTSQAAVEQSSDKAIRIIKKSHDRMERSSQNLMASTKPLFQEFAERSVELSKLIDARKELDEAGLLVKGDPDGDARRIHIDARILTETGELKKFCDSHLAGILTSLANYDRAVVNSVADSQATRSMIGNRELAMEQYIAKRSAAYAEAIQDASATLEALQNETDPAKKKRLQRKYNSSKKRLNRHEQKKQLYESRLKMAENTEKLSKLMRDNIRDSGTEISETLRGQLLELYQAFENAVAIVEVGPEMMSSGSYDLASMNELKQMANITGPSITKLSNMLGQMTDDMINQLTNGFENAAIKSGEEFSIEEEMNFLRTARESALNQ